MFLSICVPINHHSRMLFNHTIQYGYFEIVYCIVTQRVEQCVDMLFNHAMTIKSNCQCWLPNLAKTKNSRGRWARGPRMTTAALAATFVLLDTARTEGVVPFKSNSYLIEVDNRSSG